MSEIVRILNALSVSSVIMYYAKITFSHEIFNEGNVSFLVLIHAVNNLYDSFYFACVVRLDSKNGYGNPPDFHYKNSLKKSSESKCLYIIIIPRADVS